MVSPFLAAIVINTDLVTKRFDSDVLKSRLESVEWFQHFALKPFCFVVAVSSLICRLKCTQRAHAV